MEDHRLALEMAPEAAGEFVANAGEFGRRGPQRPHHYPGHHARQARDLAMLGPQRICLGHAILPQIVGALKEA
jgi:hypothetical protein